MMPPELMWVKFGENNFDSIIPIMNTNDNTISFVLFCEYLLIHEKYQLFDLLLPQLISYVK